MAQGVEAGTQPVRLPTHLWEYYLTALDAVPHFLSVSFVFHFCSVAPTSQLASHSTTLESTPIKIDAGQKVIDDLGRLAVLGQVVSSGVLRAATGRA